MEIGSRELGFILEGLDFQAVKSLGELKYTSMI